jgi:hypothetical protein
MVWIEGPIMIFGDPYAVTWLMGLFSLVTVVITLGLFLKWVHWIITGK